MIRIITTKNARIGVLEAENAEAKQDGADNYEQGRKLGLEQAAKEAERLYSAGGYHIAQHIRALATQGKQGQ